jgi:molybdopterin converting factor small subunit
MSVTVNLASYLQPYADNTVIVMVKGGTIKECLNDLVKQHSRMKEMLFNKDGKLIDYVSIFVNEEIAYIDKLDRQIKDGDTLHVMYIIGGG